jgi:ubiquinone/menaquinone biosynthesis C-methylase UbiE
VTCQKRPNTGRIARFPDLFKRGLKRSSRRTVFALDVDPEMLEATKAKVEALGLRNVEVTHRDFTARGSGLPDSSVDYVMLFNILHAEELDVLLHEGKRVLNKDGKLAVVHWNYDPSTPRGPSMDIRPRPEQCRMWVERVGFETLWPGMIDLPPFHYGFAFKMAD